jgi:N-acetyl-gamma-glutamyl-phosphate reductase
MTRIAILGASGYTALELIKLLLRHPGAEIVAVTSRQEGKQPISAVHPSLTGRIDLPLEDLSTEEIAARADCAFSCLPHGASAAVAGPLVEAGVRVIDLSADYRLTDPNVYAQWYGEKHADPGRLGRAVYGLPELFRSRIPSANLIANPGCYPTSAILPLAPLLKAGLIATDDIIVDSKSGVSGAGRTAKMTTLFPECNESMSAYNVGKHRHTPEIDQVLSVSCSKKIEVIFTPQLAPMDRGILTTAYAKPKNDGPLGEVTEEKVTEALKDFYADEPFVRVVSHFPGTKDCAFSNFCDITARVVRGRVITISCLDNLIKGASGAALQNFNLMFGYPETTALL